MEHDARGGVLQRVVGRVLVTRVLGCEAALTGANMDMVAAIGVVVLTLAMAYGLSDE